MALDAAPPPIPPRPHSSASYHYDRPFLPPAVPPPIPPLPPGFRPHEQDMHRPRSVDPILAPRPHQPVQDLSLDMLRSFDERNNVSYKDAMRFASSPPPPPPPFVQSRMINSNPGFVHPHPGPIPYYAPSPALSPPPFHPPLSSVPTGGSWRGAPDINSVTSMVAAVSLNNLPVSRVQSLRGVVEYFPRPVLSPPPRPAPSQDVRLAAPLPTISTLQNALPSVQLQTADISHRVAWIRDVFLLIKRATAFSDVSRNTSSSALSLTPNAMPPGRIEIADPALRNLAEDALALLISIIPTLPGREQKLTPPLAEVLYIHATLTASGAFPEYIPVSQRNAFREFEGAARAGYAPAWFQLGRDYETFDDAIHARQCFEKGVIAGDPACTYRMGVAHLLGGQLDLPAPSAESAEKAAQLLHRAATLATIDFPQPAYVFALLLRDEFEQASIAPHILSTYVPMNSTPAHEACRHLKRAAFLHYAPAQQRIGHVYEFAEDPFPFDPVLSMDYYTLASAGGDSQADLALSKWYLCGSPGVFPKDEFRARQYAELGAIRRLPGAKFAMGYCCEVGIGAPPDIVRARQWYEEAAALGDADAEGRLRALHNDSAPLSREQHETIAETRLVRTRTQARMRSDAANTAQTSTADLGQVGPGPEQVERRGYQRRQASLPSAAMSPHPHDRSRHGSGSSVSSPPYQQFQQNTFDGVGNGMQNGQIGFHPPNPQQQQQQQLIERPRYSLADPGVANPVRGGAVLPRPVAGAMRSASAGPGTPPMRRHNIRMSSPSLRTSPRSVISNLPFETPNTYSTNANGAPKAGGGTRYTTFAEMGIEGKRAEDKECRIM